MKLAIAAIVKNEADYLIEWFAYHITIGVSHFFVANNDSNDQTKNILRALQNRGLVTYIDFPTVGDKKPQLPAYQKLLSLCPKDIDLMAFIDADEFISLTDSNLKLVPFLEDMFSDSSVSALALNWACFGSAGMLFKEPGLVIERFKKQSAKKFTANKNYKSIVRVSDVINFQNPHHVNLRKGRYVNALSQDLVLSKDRYGVSESVIWDNLRINHYVTKSLEEFVVGKSQKGSAATKNRVKHKDYFLAHDRNEVDCSYPESLISEVRSQYSELSRWIDFANSPKPVSKDFSFLKPSFTYESIRFTKDNPVKKYTFDSLLEDNTFENKDGCWVVRGWVMCELSCSSAILEVFANSKIVWSLPSNADRKDVLKFFSEKKGENIHDVTVFGFNYRVPIKSPKASFFLVVDGKRISLGTFKSTGVYDRKPKAIKGKSGYLFLVDDSNANLEQNTGLISLSDYSVNGWKKFIYQATEISYKKNYRFSFLLTPSKEVVLADKYPFMVNNKVVDQVISCFSTWGNLCYPLEDLSKIEGSYHRTDTHWTHKGAFAAWLSVCDKLNLDRKKIDNAFSSDVYIEKNHTGDLGNKFDPGISAKSYFLAESKFLEKKIFDNGLPNTGRCWFVVNQDALYDQLLIVFGASSSYSMMNFAYRTFKRILFVHSAGSIDQSIISDLSPSFVVCQTNSRFIVNPPSTEFNLKSTIREKMESLSDDERALVKSNFKFESSIPPELTGFFRSVSQTVN